MIESKEVTINGVKYIISQFDAVKAIKLQTKLFGLFSLPPDFSGNKEDFFKLLTSIKDDKLFDLLLELVSGDHILVEINDFRVQFDINTHLKAKPFDIWSLAWEVVKINFNLGKLIPENILQSILSTIQSRVPQEQNEENTI
ncbi:MAG: hypothetical protein OMM_06616 [Candidatus Magnetoglobus multicellularis str. Araruama]|uniref:Uncharacterized protein n=1 Tax=Candidatus Magnetoglobus multicellularis str. Araruama TaxID=890399 RepID=A0A1V1PGE7_9BACT|nr:MAG: hypothetical protein OMM_06616 [Candidatus Magnetoglobus multicellularis str. Araruama]